jgi:hypothetical protein
MARLLATVSAFPALCLLPVKAPAGEEYVSFFAPYRLVCEAPCLHARHRKCLPRTRLLSMHIYCLFSRLRFCFSDTVTACEESDSFLWTTAAILPGNVSACRARALRAKSDSLPWIIMTCLPGTMTARQALFLPSKNGPAFRAHILPPFQATCLPFGHRDCLRRTGRPSVHLYCLLSRQRVCRLGTGTACEGLA